MRRAGRDAKHASVPLRRVRAGELRWEKFLYELQAEPARITISGIGGVQSCRLDPRPRSGRRPGQAREAGAEEGRKAGRDGRKQPPPETATGTFRARRCDEDQETREARVGIMVLTWAFGGGAGDGNRTRTVSWGTRLPLRSCLLLSTAGEQGCRRRSPRLTVADRPIGHAAGTTVRSVPIACQRDPGRSPVARGSMAPAGCEGPGGPRWPRRLG
jgi:hypothetical protein